MPPGLIGLNIFVFLQTNKFLVSSTKTATVLIFSTVIHNSLAELFSCFCRKAQSVILQGFIKTVFFILENFEIYCVHIEALFQETDNVFIMRQKFALFHEGRSYSIWS